MTSASTNVKRARGRAVLRWTVRGLLIACVASGLYLFAIRIAEWPNEIAITWAAAVGSLALLLVWLCLHRHEAPEVRRPVRYPLILPGAPRRARFQFGIGSLLVLMTITALVTAVIRRDGWPPVYLITTCGAALVLFSAIAWAVARLPTWAAAGGFFTLCLLVTIILANVYYHAPRTGRSISGLLEPHGPPWRVANILPMSLLVSACVLTGTAVGWAMSAAEQRA